MVVLFLSVETVGIDSMNKKPLTEKQQAFVRELLKFHKKKGKFVAQTYRDAAIAAGYSEKSAKQVGSKLSKDPRVKEELDRLRAMAEEKTIIDRNGVINLVLEGVQKALKGYPFTDKDGKIIAVRIEPCAPQMLDVLCKCTGSYAEEKIAHSVSGSGEKFGIILNLEGKSKDENV